jgi:Sec-independent protein secretion pathway component TatC
MAVLGTFSLLTWFNLWFTRYNQRNQIQKQVNRMMVAEFAMALITTLPNFIYNLYVQITQYVDKPPLRSAQENLWASVSATISFTMNVGTFYVYMIVSPAYRRNVRTALCFKKQNQIGTQQIELKNGTTGQQLGYTTSYT